MNPVKMFFRRNKDKVKEPEKWPNPLPQHRWLICYVFKPTAVNSIGYGNYNLSVASESCDIPPFTQHMVDKVEKGICDAKNKSQDDFIFRPEHIIIISINYLGWTTDKDHGA